MSSSLFPQMTTADRDDIGSPTAGQIIWNETTVTHQGWNGTAWVDIGLGSAGTDDAIFTINQDAVAGTAEDTILRMLAGDGTNLNRFDFETNSLPGLFWNLIFRQYLDGVAADSVIVMGHADGTLGSELQATGPGDAATEVVGVSLNARTAGVVGIITARWAAATPGTPVAGQDSPTLLVTQSEGAAADAVVPGGNVGPIVLQGGQGGVGSAAQSSGDGASVEIDSGEAGASGGGGQGTAGDIKLMTKHVNQNLVFGVVANQWSVGVCQLVIGATGAEVNNPPDTIDIPITIADNGNAGIPGIIEVRLFDTTSLVTPSNAANHRLTESGGGAVLSGDNTNQIEISFPAGGCIVRIEDVAGGTGASRTVVIRILTAGVEGQVDMGGAKIRTVTFD